MSFLKRKKRLGSNQANLFGKTLGQINDENRLKADIENLKKDLEEIQHLQSCQQCRILLILDIERYGGRRSPWYLNLINDVSTNTGFDFEGCPKPKDYEIGSYWKSNSPGTWKFIRDRLQWALRFAQTELKDREEQLKFTVNLKHW